MPPATVSSQTGFDQLYTAHHGWLKGWIWRKLGHGADASDLAHDVFVRVLASCRLAELREPRAYLTTVAHGVVVNHIRRRDIERAYLDALAAQPEPVAPDPETLAALVETLTAVARLIDGLPSRTREIFLLAQLDGLPYAVIADRLGTSVNMVQKHMSRAFEHCYLALHA